IVLFIALVYAELGAMIPRSGAIVRYGQMSHGSLAGYLFGWAYFLSAVSVPPIEAIAVVSYAGSYSPQYGIDLVGTTGVLTFLGIVLAALLMVLFFFLNYFGIKIMGKVNTGVTWWKLIIPAGTVIILFAVGFNAVNFNVGAGFVANGWANVFGAIATTGIVFSYLGFRQAVDYAGEAKTPQKSVPIAVVGSVLIGIVLYVGLQIAFIGHVDWTAIGLKPGDWAGLLTGSSSGLATLGAAPFATLASSAGLVLLTYLLYADAYVSPSGTLNVYLGTSQRTLYGLGTNGYYSKLLMKVNEKSGIPVLPLIASLVIGIIFFAPFPSWYKLVGFISGSTVFTYIVGGSALTTLRTHAKELHRPFKLPGSKILAPLAFVGASLIVYWSGWPLVGYLAIAIFLGIIVYLVFLLGGHSESNIFEANSVKGGIWVVVYIIVLVVLSYLGEYGAGYIVFPYDVVVVAVVSVFFYLWSIKSGFLTEEIDAMIKNGTQFVKEE
ncbi:MAG: APC family permease, partial [Candidatus Thermoplasmatota archaeon]|nr:APC family permease [Candidatus Thermoplasmatota archaeon]